MSQQARKGRRAGRVVLQIYRQHAEAVADAASRLGVTCKEGCAHCCMLPATATVPEMVPVVDDLAQRDDWRVRRPALEKALAVQLTAFAGVDVLDANEREGFFRRQLPCMFLKDRRCEIYALRPAVCRYHMVVSPPENCANGAADSSVVRVDTRDVETAVAVLPAQEFGELLGGPIAVAFVLAAQALGVKLDIDATLLERVMITRVPMDLHAPG